MTIDNPYVTVSGLPAFEEVKRQTTFPSGIFNTHVEAYLSAFNANFGFNGTPHKFDLEYIPAKFTFNALPSIGSGVSMSIGDFYISGRIKHADWSKSEKGKVLSISIEDVREDLSDYYIDTYGIFGSADAPTTNIIDVRHWYIKTYAETRTYGRSRIIRDLDLLEQQGASYRQIYDAIKYFENTVGSVNDLIAKLPLPEVIESQLPQDPDAYRWKFKSEPLLQSISKIFEDISYEWYWNMKDSKINVINRKYAIDIDETDIPVPNDPNPLRSLRYGKDEGERPTTVRLFGAEMEGLIGSGLYMTQSGAYGLDGSQYDMGIEVGKLRFVPGWKAKLKYFGPDGWLHSYVPGDRELSSALKGLEFWCMEKGLDNRISNNTYNAVNGRTTFQESISGSGMGRILNRRTRDRAWIVEWYNRVRTFATNHYGRTYVLDAKSPLYNYIDDIEVLPSAWCNIENQIDSGEYDDNYKISEKYKWLAIFWEADANKMHPFAMLSSSTKWGADGEGTPGTDYNLNETTYYVPIEVKKWDLAHDKFSEDFLETLGDEKGIMVQLPNIAWKDFRKKDDNLAKHHTLISLNKFFSGQTTMDIHNPYDLPEPYSELNSVSLPVKVKRRYGYSYPQLWASGTGVAREVIISDEYAPWNFQPRGTKSSTELMNDEAQAALTGKIVNRNEVTFAEVIRINLPTISFDNFAKQSEDVRGYGIVSHGVTAINLTKNMDWWQTKYSIKSHFPEFIKAKPVNRDISEDFNFMLQRMANDLRKDVKIDPYRVPTFFQPKSDDGRESIKMDTGIEQKLERWVTISNVYNRGEDEYYLGVDEFNISWPRALDAGFGGSELKVAHCVDGFLQVGMNAIYHLEISPDGTAVQYFTGGIPLTAGRIVELIESPRLLQGIYVASCRTLQTLVVNPKTGQTVTVEPFYFYNTPFAQQGSIDTSLKSSDKAMLSGDGNTKMLIPDADYGPSSTNFNKAFLVNTTAPPSVMFGYVTSKPDTNGRTGAIRTYSPTGGTAYVDGSTVGGKTYNIYFVGCEVTQVQVNDPCIISEMREQTGAYRLYCFINKPAFTGTGTFGV